MRPAPTPNTPASSSISTIEIIGGLVGFIVGAALALVFLFLKPTPVVEEWPSKPEAGMVYNVKGSKVRTSYWKQMRYAFYTPRRIKITLREDDLNKWAASTLSITEPSKNVKTAPALEFKAHGAPNFRIEDGNLYVSLAFDLKAYGATLPILWQTSGDFEKTDWGYDFVPRDMYLGSLPIPSRLATLVMDQLILPVFEEKTEPAKLKEVWQKLAWIKVQDDVIQVARTE